MEDTDNFSPLRVLAMLWQHRLLIALCTIASIGLSSLYAFTATLQYRAEALLAPSSDQASGLGMAQLAGAAWWARILGRDQHRFWRDRQGYRGCASHVARITRRLRNGQ